MPRLKHLLVLSILLITGCKVGPNFHPAKPPVTEYTSKPLPQRTLSVPVPGGRSQEFIPGGDIPFQWWTLFRSPEIDLLICRGLSNSPNLEAAQAALRQAQENLKAEIGAGLVPSIQSNFSVTRQQQPGATYGVQNFPNSIFTLYNASVSANYTLDLFGGIRRQIEAVGAQVDFERYELLGAYLSLTSNIVTTAVNLASIEAQIAETGKLIKAQAGSLKILRLQYNLGGTALANVETQATLLAQTQATLPPLQKNLEVLKDSLTALVGALPSESNLPDIDLDRLHLPEQLPISLPSKLVEQRPDVQAAAALVHQASAQIGVATANLLPQINLSADLGSSALNLNQLFSAQAEAWRLMGEVTQTVFNGGALLFQRRAAIAAFQQAAAQYQQTVLTAFQNVADSLNAIVIDARNLQAQVAAENAAKKNLDITWKQYKLGGIPYLSVLEAQQQYEQIVIARIQAQAARYSDTAALFQSLGGGWWNLNKEPQMVTSLMPLPPSPPPASLLISKSKES